MNGYVLLLVTVVSFATYPSIAPIGLGSGLSPFGFVFQAMLVTMILMVSANLIRRRRIVPENLVAVLGLSAVFLLEHLALLYSLRHIEVPVAMAIIYTYPTMVAGFQALTGAERVSFQFALAALVCFGGVVLVVGFAPEGLRPIGVLLALAQAILAATRIVLTGRLVKNTEPILLATQMLLGASIVAALGAPFMEWSLPATGVGWLAVLGAGISGFCGHSCLTLAIDRVGALRSSFILNLEPIVATVLSALFLAQVLTTVQYFGCILVVTAVATQRYWELRVKAV